MSEATSELADPNRRGEGWRYKVDVPYTDYAADALRIARAARAKAYPDEDTSALIFPVVKVPKT